MATDTIAPALHAVLPPAVRVVGYDGSAAGPGDAAVTVHVRDPRALTHLVLAPGELGLARGYVAGLLDLDAPDHRAALEALATEAHFGDLTWTQRLSVLRTLAAEVLHWVEPPPQEVGAKRYLSGLRSHTRARDAAAIAHHYDVSNGFYELVLGPSMTYSCAAYPTEGASLEQAQRHKVDLICRKLGLRPGMRLLDIGCGWGALACHAAERYGVDVVGVTISQQQVAWAQKAVSRAGLAHQVDIRLCDYRDVTDGDFDAISSVGMSEHVGLRHLDGYAARLAALLRPRGRLLNHCITRPDEDSPALRRRGFVARYVFPDGELAGLGRLVGSLQRADLEVRHAENLREHYARTLGAWSANLDRHWDAAVREVGEGTARVWALYLAGARIAFARNQIQLQQVLVVKGEDGDAGMPLRPDWGA